MVWYGIDPEERTVTEVQEPRTIKALSRWTAISIGRWLLSGLDVPDSQATDGVSEVEGAMELQ